jgi:hypothetical protein
MPRTLTGPVSAAFGATVVRYLEFYELDFASGYLRVCNGAHDVTWNGLTWAGWGRVVNRSTIEESGGFSAPQVTLTLGAVDPSIAAIALGEQYRNRPARIWVAPLDVDGTVMADPAGPWLYRMDTMPMNIGETASIAVTLSTIEEQWKRAPGGRVNHQDQQARFPGDRGLEYLDQEAMEQRMWGSVPLPASTTDTRGSPVTNPFNPSYSPPFTTLPGVTGAGTSWAPPTTGPGSDRPYG